MHLAPWPVLNVASWVDCVPLVLLAVGCLSAHQATILWNAVVLYTEPDLGSPVYLASRQIDARSRSLFFSCLLNQT